MDSRLRGHR